VLRVWVGVIVRKLFPECPNPKSEKFNATRQELCILAELRPPNKPEFLKDQSNGFAAVSTLPSKVLNFLM
jgi:hypothetical protein